MALVQVAQIQRTTIDIVKQNLNVTLQSLVNATQEAKCNLIQAALEKAELLLLQQLIVKYPIILQDIWGSQVTRDQRNIVEKGCNKDEINNQTARTKIYLCLSIWKWKRYI